MKYARAMRFRKDDHYIDADGNNLFEIALKIANDKEGKIEKVKIFDLDGTNERTSTMTFGKYGDAGHIGVEYHNRWCFYYDDRNGRTFLADTRDGKVIAGNGVQMFRSEYEAIEQALKNCGIEY